jgi:integrase
MRFLTVAEVRRLAVAIGPAYRALILLGAYGGLRIGEMAGLRRKRLDLAAGVVEVAEVVTEMHGHLYLGPPKTTAGRRRVGLPRVVVEALQEHLAGRSVEPDGFVFARSNGGPLRTANFRTRVWRPATRAAGLEGLRIHDLRHTAVALWIAAGAGPKEVATRAGHTSVSFTLRPAMPSRPRRGPGAKRAPPASRPRCSDLLGWVVGLPGLEPGTSSLSEIDS